MTISLFFKERKKNITAACTFIGWVPVIAKMVPGHQKVITERIKGTTITVREARKEKRGRRRKKKVEKKPPKKTAANEITLTGIFQTL